jgi:D-3-phosphoglycerate dehydrogenase
MRPKVWVDGELTGDAEEELASAAEIVYSSDLRDLPGAHAAIVRGSLDVDGAFYDQAGEHLRVVARRGIGIDNVNLSAATERGIAVINTPDAPTESTAEHTVALLLAVAKRVVAGAVSLQGGEIKRTQLLGTEVRGRVLGVVGFGRIGSRVAEICARGLGMQVIGYDPYVNPSEVSTHQVEMLDSLDALLTEADFVTLHTPLVLETRSLIGQAELGKMKPGAYIINTSRGAVVDESALVEALRQGQLAGAALDVFDPEPPAPDNPLLRMANVVATPHIGSHTDKATRAKNLGAVRQVMQVLRGERPRCLANPRAWPGRAGKRATER